MVALPNFLHRHVVASALRAITVRLVLRVRNKARVRQDTCVPSDPSTLMEEHPRLVLDLEVRYVPLDILAHRLHRLFVLPASTRP